ncbi:hypothetical protein [Hymenobacter sp.]|uniref:hypothetical protein n=1 Tax=Hymenobacter sp. TaxID=1898978 RepID=UPI002EDBABB9
MNDVAFYHPHRHQKMQMQSRFEKQKNGSTVVIAHKLNGILASKESRIKNKRSAAAEKDKLAKQPLFDGWLRRIELHQHLQLDFPFTFLKILNICFVPWK